MGRESIIIWFIPGSLFSLVRIFSSVSEEDEHLWCAQNNQISQFECSQPYIPQIWYDVIAWWYIWCAKEPNTKFAKSLLCPSPSPESTKISQAKTMVKKAGESGRKKKSSAFLGSRSWRVRTARSGFLHRSPLTHSSFSTKLVWILARSMMRKDLTRRSQDSMKLWHTHTHSFFPFLSFADSTSKWDSRVHLHNTRACVFTISVACSCSCLCYRCWWCSWRCDFCMRHFQPQRFSRSSLPPPILHLTLIDLCHL